MQTRHTNPDQYFAEQSATTARYVIPFIQRVFHLKRGMTVAEIGCGGGGNMLPFLDMGCRVYGVDICAKSIENAGRSYEGHPERENLTLIASDVYDIDPHSLPGFDLIVVRDVLEHIHDHERFMKHLHDLLKPGGGIFLSFPPFSMPFGGHQQMCRNRLASRMPYYHLLPRRLYAAVLRFSGESHDKITGLLEIKDTRIDLRKFHKILQRSYFKTVSEQYYLVNPNYEVKFGLKPRRLPAAMNVPVLREFFITTCYIFIIKDIE